MGKSAGDATDSVRTARARAWVPLFVVAIGVATFSACSASSNNAGGSKGGADGGGSSGSSGSSGSDGAPFVPVNPTCGAPGTWPASTVYPTNPQLPTIGKNIYGLGSLWGDIKTDNCIAPLVQQDGLVGAMSQQNFVEPMCGACVLASGYKSTVKIKIITLCEACLIGGIDLSKGAWDALADPQIVGIEGHTHLTYRFVPCTDPNPISIYYVPGFGPEGPVLKVLNQAKPVSGMEVQVNGQWEVCKDSPEHKFFLPILGTKPDDPITIRITALDGECITETLPAYHSGEIWTGTNQFSTADEVTSNPDDTPWPHDYQGIPQGFHNLTEKGVHDALWQVSLPTLFDLTDPLTVPASVTAAGVTYPLSWRWLPYPDNNTAVVVNGTQLSVNRPPSGQKPAYGRLLAWTMVGPDGGQRPVTRHWEVRVKPQ